MVVNLVSKATWYKLIGLWGLSANKTRLSAMFTVSTIRAPVFDRHQFFGTSAHYGKAHGSLLSGWMNYNDTACCWFPTSSNISILPSQFWQIRFESCWLHCSKCRILVLLRYIVNALVLKGANKLCGSHQTTLGPLCRLYTPRKMLLVYVQITAHNKTFSAHHHSD